MTIPYWIIFTGRDPGCVEAENPEQAKALAAEITGNPVASCDRLPYPAHPRLNEHKDKDWGVCPSFCYRPNSCAGSSSCPQRISCTE